MRSLTYWIYRDSQNSHSGLFRYAETKRQNFPLQKRTNIEMLRKRLLMFIAYSKNSKLPYNTTYISFYLRCHRYKIVEEKASANNWLVLVK